MYRLLFQIIKVCDFINYLHYIQRGLVKSSAHDVYWEINRLRKEIVLARLGLTKDEDWTRGLSIVKQVLVAQFCTRSMWVGGWKKATKAVGQILRPMLHENSNAIWYGHVPWL